MMARSASTPGALAAILALIAVAAGVGGYILANQRLRFPLVEEAPMRLKAELATAQAVTPGQGQTVRVSGVQIGEIGEGRARGRARASSSSRSSRSTRALIREDATALLRPKTALKDMFLEVDPGAGKPLEEGDTVPARQHDPGREPGRDPRAARRATRATTCGCWSTAPGTG